MRYPGESLIAPTVHVILGAALPPVPRNRPRSSRPANVAMPPDGQRAAGVGCPFRVENRSLRLRADLVNENPIAGRVARDLRW